MNYLAALLGLALAGAVTTAAIWRADAADYKSQLVTLKASYQQTADKAKADAQAQEQKDIAALNLQSSQAIQQAQSSQLQAQQQLALYLARGRASGVKDLSHECFNVPIAPDLLPGAK